MRNPQVNNAIEEGVAINDDVALEKGADAMGANGRITSQSVCPFADIKKLDFGIAAQAHGTLTAHLVDEPVV